MRYRVVSKGTEDKSESARLLFGVAGLFFLSI
jgi:hypothetical protein